MDNSYLSEQCY